MVSDEINSMVNNLFTRVTWRSNAGSIVAACRKQRRHSVCGRYWFSWQAPCICIFFSFCCISGFVAWFSLTELCREVYLPSIILLGATSSIWMAVSNAVLNLRFHLLLRCIGIFDLANHWNKCVCITATLLSNNCNTKTSKKDSRTKIVWWSRSKIVWLNNSY